MKLKPRSSANKKSDALRFTIAGLALLSLLLTTWNRYATPLHALESGYKGYVIRGESLQNQIVSEDGVALVRRWIEERTRPSYNPIVILRHYFSHTRRPPFYTLIIGLRAPGAGKADGPRRDYGIYVSGQTLYLQVAPAGIDRVLRTSFTARELEAALDSYIEGPFTLEY